MDAISVVGRSTSTPARQALADFLRRFSWDWFATLTFRDSFRPGAAWRAFGRWMREVSNDETERWGGSSPYWFTALEYGSGGSAVPHLHSLVGSLGGLLGRRDEAWRSWFRSYGRARIEPFEPQRGADWYCCKYMLKEDNDRAEWDVGGAIYAMARSSPRASVEPAMLNLADVV